jgi:enterochelin esterase-like enzyme
MPVATASATAVPTNAPAVVIPIVTATPPAKAPCAETAGRVLTFSIASETLNYPFDGRVYLPPCYAAGAERYPVLYLVHGLGFTDDQWPRLGVVTATNDLIAAGAIAPLIIVMPRDRRDERFDPALVDDLIPYIDGHYRTKTDRLYRAIGGLSRGGGWAAHLGLRYYDLFSRLGLHSPAVFYGDENNLLQYGRALIKALPPGDYPAIYMDIGATDKMRVSADWLDQVFTWFKFKQQYIVQDGAHIEKYWAAHVREYLRFYAADWRALAPPVTPTPSYR